MNKRQRKKIARIKNDWFKGKKTYEYDCPCCSWSALNDDEFKYHKTLSQHQYYTGQTNYDFEVKCPCCGIKFQYSDSNM